MSAPKYWLMKAEPDSRIVKGKDVKFSVDDFESVESTPWEGVRNHQAKNYMKSMSVGDKVLFYHSNCKVPGIAGFAEVSKEAYPDYTAWDPDHPYYDAKSDQEKPRWYMVDVTFTARATHFVPYPFLRDLAASGSAEPPEGMEYIGEEGVAAIKGMELVTRGRLSVQKVEDKAFETIEMMAERGGWDENGGKAKVQKGTSRRGGQAKARKGKEKEGEGESDDAGRGRKRKAGEGEEARGVRRSTRRKG